MKAYTYYSKSDPKKEPIMTWPSSSIEEAITSFAKLKDLPVQEFTRIFEVVKYERS